ncbi:MAG: Hsp20/alpha crystallin family protein [Planctomycetota bacterium]
MATDDNLTKPTASEAGEVERTRCGRCYRPNCDILENADEILVMADVPGARADAIDINFEDGTLSILAKVEPRTPEKGEALLSEYGVGDYYRTFQVSEAIDVERISAEFADGVLTLHLPKAEAVKPRKIQVQS